MKSKQYLAMALAIATATPLVVTNIVPSMMVMADSGPNAAMTISGTNTNLDNQTVVQAGFAVVKKTTANTNNTKLIVEFESPITDAVKGTIVTKLLRDDGTSAHGLTEAATITPSKFIRSSNGWTGLEVNITPSQYHNNEIVAVQVGSTVNGTIQTGPQAGSTASISRGFAVGVIINQLARTDLAMPSAGASELTLSMSKNSDVNTPINVNDYTYEYGFGPANATNITYRPATVGAVSGSGSSATVKLGLPSGVTVPAGQQVFLRIVSNHSSSSYTTTTSGVVQAFQIAYTSHSGFTAGSNTLTVVGNYDDNAHSTSFTLTRNGQTITVPASSVTRNVSGGQTTFQIHLNTPLTAGETVELTGTASGASANVRETLTTQAASSATAATTAARTSTAASTTARATTAATTARATTAASTTAGTTTAASTTAGTTTAQQPTPSATTQVAQPTQPVTTQVAQTTVAQQPTQPTESVVETTTPNTVAIPTKPVETATPTDARRRSSGGGSSSSGGSGSSTRISRVVSQPRTEISTVNMSATNGAKEEEIATSATTETTAPAPFSQDYKKNAGITGGDSSARKVTATTVEERSEGRKTKAAVKADSGNSGISSGKKVTSAKTSTKKVPKTADVAPLATSATAIFTSIVGLFTAGKLRKKEEDK